MEQNRQLKYESARFDVDVNLTITGWDDGMVCFTGLSPEAVNGRPLDAIFPDLGRRGLLRRFHRVVQEGTVEILAPSFHKYLISCAPLSPSLRFDKMQQRAKILPVHEGEEVVGAVVTIEDVTSRLERERELAEQLASSDEEERLRAAQQLAHSEPVSGVPPLVAAISDSSWRVRRIAVDGFTRQPGAEGIDELIRLIRKDHRNLSLLNSALKILAETTQETLPALMNCLSDDDAGLRMQVLLVLGQQGNVQAIPTLLGALSDPDENVRFHAIEALGRLKAREAVIPLIEIAESEGFFLGFAALTALGQIGDASVASRVIPLLKNDELAAAAAEVLGALGEEKALGSLMDLFNNAGSLFLAVARAIAALYDRLEESGEGVRVADYFRLAVSGVGIDNLKKSLRAVNGDDLRTLVMLMGWTDDPASSNSLIDLLGEPEAGSEVIDALVRRGTHVTELLTRQLDSSDVNIRRSAITILGQIRDPSSIPSLVKVLSDDEELRIVAADALARIGDERAIEPLVNTLGDQDAAVRLASVGALNRIAPPEMSTRVEVLLNDPSPRVREAAVRIAGYYGYATDQLIEHCRDIDERVRRAAVETLPFLDDDRSNVTLASALETDVPAVRAAAAAVLAHCSSDFATPLLIKALGDKDAWVRYFAARSLGNYVSADAIEPLMEVAQADSAVYVRVAAIEALGATNEPMARAVISKLVDSANSDIAKAALAQLKGRNGDDLPNRDSESPAATPSDA